MTRAQHSRAQPDEHERTQREQRAFALTRVDDESSSPVALDLQSQRLELDAGEQGVMAVKLTIKTASQPLAPPGAGRGKDSNQTAGCVKVKLAVTPLAPVGCGVQAEPDVPDLVELLVRLP